MQKIIEELNSHIAQYDESVEILDGLTFSQKDTLKTIYHYTASQYTNKKVDRRGRPKPFYNIINQAIDKAIRESDLDTKDISVVADEPQFAVQAYVMQKEVKAWMKRVNFARTLNELCETRPTYGGVLAKKVIREDGELDIEVPVWKNVITDQVDIEDGIIVERHYMTPLELQKKKGVWDEDAVEEALKLAKKDRKDTYGETIYGKTVVVYEMEGEFPEEMYDEDGKEDVYKRYVFYIAGESKKDRVVLYKEELDESRYRYLPWKRVDGRGLGRGIAEDGFNAQVETNDTILREKEAMEVASKVGFKTDDEMLEDNVLNDLDNGYIIKLTEGRDFTMVNSTTNALPEFNNYRMSWGEQFAKTVSVYEANTGETMPSGTPFRQVALLNQEANSPFAYRREQMGIWLTEIFNDWILPSILKKINKEHILAAEFTQEELHELDEAYVSEIIEGELNNAILSGQVVNRQQVEVEFDRLTKILNQTKQHRYLDIPKDFFKKAKMHITIDPTGETRNKQATLESLSTILEIYSKNPAVLNDPRLSQVFTRMVELADAGISSIHLKPLSVAPQSNAQPNMPALPQQGAVPSPAPTIPNGAGAVGNQPSLPR